MKKKYAFSFLVLILLLFSNFLVNSQPKTVYSNTKKEHDLETSSSPIIIFGNSDLASLCDYGIGSKDQPYVIENKTIDGIGEITCIFMFDTTDYLIIRNSSFFNADNYGIYLSNVTNVMITNCSFYDNKIEGDGHVQSAFYMEESYNNTIYDNDVFNNEYGIFTAWSRDINITYNRVFANDYLGIWLYNSTNHTICGNEVSNNGNNGIYLYLSANNTIIDNIINYNDEGIFLDHSNDTKIIGNEVKYNELWYVDYFGTNNIIRDNEWWLEDAPIVIDGDVELALRSDHGLGTKDNPYTIENKSINLYSWSTDDYVGYGFSKVYGYGIVIMDTSKHFIIRNCSVFNGQHAIYLRNCSNGVIYNNTIYDNEFVGTGIRLHDCEFINISKNKIVNNGWYGIRIFSSHNNSICNNTIDFHEYGISLEYSTENNITWNRLYENEYCITEDVFSEGLNLIANNTCSKAIIISSGNGNGNGNGKDDDERLIFGYNIIIIASVVLLGFLYLLFLNSKSFETK